MKIRKCPSCEWILSATAKRCPKCGADIPIPKYVSSRPLKKLTEETPPASELEDNQEE